jgi:hypothetical protein
MNLAQSYQRGHQVPGDSFGKQLTVPDDILAVIVRGKSKVEFAGGIFRAVGAGNSATAGAEACP